MRGGLAGSGMHDFLIDEIEYGGRVAVQLDDPEQAFWALHWNDPEISGVSA